jgi:AcrR family transcriptional regulator
VTTVSSRRQRARRGEGPRLRAEILAATKRLLAEKGSEDAVSVRDVADAVGVTTPSVYLHFADKQALIEAVCEDVFTELDNRMEEAAVGVTDPLTALHARGSAYIRFALENAEQYRIVMMQRPRESFSPTSTPGFEHLVGAVRDCMQADVFDPSEDPELVALTLWSAVHGVASLLIAKPDIYAEYGAQLVERMLSATATGLAVRR